MSQRDNNDKCKDDNHPRRIDKGEDHGGKEEVQEVLNSHLAVVGQIWGFTPVTFFTLFVTAFNLE